MNLVKVYRSRKKQEMYLYVNYQEDLTRVPEALLAQFGKPVLAVSLDLQPDRVLARAEASTVLAQIAANGYYLQLPPPPEEASRL